MRGYSFLYEDTGYSVMKENRYIDQLFPYKPDIDPRLVRFMRTSYYYKKHGIIPCVPLAMEYTINKKDWIDMDRYVRKYNIQAVIR